MYNSRMNLQGVIDTLSNLPIEWLLIGVFAALIALWIAAYGAREACAVALAAPLASFMTALMRETYGLQNLLQRVNLPHMDVIVFLALFIVLVLLMSRIETAYGTESGQPLPAAAAGVATTAILLVVFMHEPVLQTLYIFGPQVQAVFAEPFQLFWLLGSFAALAFVRS